MLDKGMSAMQSGLALQCCKHKGKGKARGGETRRRTRSERQVRRGAGEKVRGVEEEVD